MRCSLADALAVSEGKTFKSPESRFRTEVTDVPAGATIALINYQPAMEKVLITQRGTGYTVYVIPHSLSQDAIRSLTSTQK